jgi:UDP-N-acetylglucosamine 4,6-dehydratase/UDP-glucose 4-epimerase
MKKKIFITGGTGTVGKSFIKKYINDYEIYSYARNEKAQVSLKRQYPEIEIIMGGVENYSLLNNEICKVSPAIILHAAALKHVDTAEKQPSQAVLTNIIGSYNVIKSAINNNTELTVGISTDKACSPENVYGQSKYLMERLFLEANSKNNKFVCCRFGNVAWSNGSVIPFWITRKQNNQKLFLTDKKMTRLMFSQLEAAKLIKKCIDRAENNGGFICSKIMKTVNMYKMAKLISNDIEIIGLRPGEKLYEDLISEKELPFSYIDGDYVFLRDEINHNLKTRLNNVLSSRNAVEMNKNEMNLLIDNVNDIFNKKNIDHKNY